MDNTFEAHSDHTDLVATFLPKRGKYNLYIFGSEYDDQFFYEVYSVSPQALQVLKQNMNFYLRDTPSLTAVDGVSKISCTILPSRIAEKIATDLDTQKVFSIFETTDTGYATIVDLRETLDEFLSERNDDDEEGIAEEDIDYFHEYIWAYPEYNIIEISKKFNDILSKEY